MSYAGQTFLFFMKCPDLKNLLSFYVELPYNNQEQGLHLFHRRIFKCRELIFSESELVATPSNFSTTQIVAIIPKSKFYNAAFQKKLDRMRLSVLKIDDVSPNLLQECLQYTATAKLAPQWNTVQNLLVQGRDFLMISDPLRAIKLDIFVNGDEITLSVAPKCIKLPHFKSENYAKIYGFSGNITSMQETCHLLPSLKKGKAISLSKSVLTTDVYKNYSDIKKHWKNMYGYRLPDIPDENIWYVTITFNVPFSTPYTYPSFCVRPFGMTEVRQIDPQLTIHPFISDFCKKVDSICNEKCRILDLRASFPSLKLYPAQDVTKDALPRIGTAHTMVQTVPFSSSTVMRTNNEKLINKSHCGMNPITTKPKENRTSGNDLNLFPTNATENSTKKSRDQKGNITTYGKNICNQTQVASHIGRSLEPLNNGSFKSNEEKHFNNQNINGRNLADYVLYSGKQNVNCHTVSKSYINNCISLTPSGDKGTAQEKYAPRFFPKKPKQHTQSFLTDAFPKVKCAKYAPKFCADKLKGNPQSYLSTQDSRKHFSLKSNSNQIKMSTVIEKGLSKTNTNDDASLELNDFQQDITQKRKGEGIGSSKRMKGKQNSLQNKSKKQTNINKPTVRKYARKT